MPSVAVVSHPHFDHLHLPSLRKLSPEVRIVAPVGTARALARAAPAISRRVEEVAPGEAVDVDGVVIRAVRAAHDDRRSPLSHYRAPPLGFIIEAGSENPMRVWFAGDTRLFTEMSDFRPVDVAVIPIGGWGPPRPDPPSAQPRQPKRRAGSGQRTLSQSTLGPSGHLGSATSTGSTSANVSSRPGPGSQQPLRRAARRQLPTCSRSGTPLPSVTRATTKRHERPHIELRLPGRAVRDRHGRSGGTFPVVRCSSQRPAPPSPLRTAR